MSERTILVTGATGQQGGALARLLLERGHRVRALTRQPGSPAARALARRGAEIASGDFEDRASLARATAGAEAVFAMGTAFEEGGAVEARQTIALAEAAQAAGAAQFVYSSAAGAHEATGIPHLESKRRVEECLANLGLPFTIVAPVFFMENLLGPLLREGLREGRLALALPPARRLQQVAVADLASFTAHVLESRDRFLGRRIEVASDEPTGAEAALALSRATGRPILYEEVSLDRLLVLNEDFGRVFEWLERAGPRADVEGLRRDYPAVGWRRFADWAREQDWGALGVAAVPPAEV
jgi:uncharacterized protein YbjT (DUF2867 family)